MSDHYAESTLTYFIPKPLVEKHFHIPESHNLHICPSACGRRNAIWAIEHEEKDTVSFLNITEADVVSGDYEIIIQDAIEELLSVLDPKPRAFILFFKCIDDFLATDEEALLDSLRMKFPSVRFVACHIDPVRMDEKIFPGMRLHKQMYSLLEYSGKMDDGVNFIGNSLPIDPESELFTVLAGWGIRYIRNIFECKTFDEFMRMADSRLNLVFMRMGQLAAGDMFEELKIPFYYSPVSYDIDVVFRDYNNIASILGKESPDFRREIADTRQYIQQTKALIGDMPIVIDSSATMKPLAFTRTMVGYGFNVQAVFPLHIRETDEDDRKWIVENCPHIQIIRSESYQTVLGYGLDRNCIAIGYSSAFTLQAQHFVNIRRDETFFGFHGIRKMMGLIRNSYRTKYTW